MIPGLAGALGAMHLPVSDLGRPTEFQVAESSKANCWAPWGMEISGRQGRSIAETFHDFGWLYRCASYFGRVCHPSRLITASPYLTRETAPFLESKRLSHSRTEELNEAARAWGTNGRVGDIKTPR